MYDVTTTIFAKMSPLCFMTDIELNALLTREEVNRIHYDAVDTEK